MIQAGFSAYYVTPLFHGTDAELNSDVMDEAIELAWSTSRILQLPPTHIPIARTIYVVDKPGLKIQGTWLNIQDHRGSVFYWEGEPFVLDVHIDPDNPIPSSAIRLINSSNATFENFGVYASKELGWVCTSNTRLGIQGSQPTGSVNWTGVRGWSINGSLLGGWCFARTYDQREANDSEPVFTRCAVNNIGRGDPNLGNDPETYHEYEPTGFLIEQGQAKEVLIQQCTVLGTGRYNGDVGIGVHCKRGSFQWDGKGGGIGRLNTAFRWDSVVGGNTHVTGGNFESIRRFAHIQSSWHHNTLTLSNLRISRDIMTSDDVIINIVGASGPMVIRELDVDGVGPADSRETVIRWTLNKNQRPAPIGTLETPASLSIENCCFGTWHLDDWQAFQLWQGDHTSRRVNVRGCVVVNDDQPEDRHMLFEGRALEATR